MMDSLVSGVPQNERAQETKDLSQDHFIPTKFIGGILRRYANWRYNEDKDKAKEVAGSLWRRLLLSIAIFGAVGSLVFLLPNGAQWQVVLLFLWFSTSPILIDLFEFSMDDFWERYPEIWHPGDRKQHFEKYKNEREGSIYPFETKKQEGARGWNKFAWAMVLVSLLFVSIALLVGIFIDFFSDPNAARPSIFAWLMNVTDSSKIALTPIQTFPMHAIYVALVMALGAIILSVLSHLFITILWIVRDVCHPVLRNTESEQEGKKIRLVFNPYHVDGFGGLSPIGTLTVRVTSFYASSSLWLPFLLSRLSGASDPILLGMTGAALALWFLGLVLTFAVPLFHVHNFMRREKKKELEKIAKEIRRESGRHGDPTRALLALERFRIVKEVRVWPFSPKVLFELAGAVSVSIGNVNIGIFIR